MSGDRCGQACALTVLTPIVPGREGELRDYLQGMRDSGSPLRRLPGTHFGRWVIVPDLVTDPEQPRVDSLGCQYLLFTSSFDGPMGGYLDDLCRELAPEAPDIWGRCVGCPRPAAGAALKAYLMRNRVPTGFFVAAYPGATVAEVVRSLDVRRRMIDLAVRAQGMGPSDLRGAFLEEFST